jgi:hypothetical protein
MTIRELTAALAAWPPDARVLVEIRPGTCAPLVAVSSYDDATPGPLGLVLREPEERDA